MGDFGENSTAESNDQKPPVDQCSEFDVKEEKIPGKEFDPSASLEQKMEFVMSSRANIPAILHAAKIGDLDVCEYLVKQGENVSVTDEKGNGVYHYAALNETFGEQLINYFMELMDFAAVTCDYVARGLTTLRDRFGNNASLFKDKSRTELNTDLLIKAAAFSDLDTFRWIYDKASKLDKKLIRSKEWQLLIYQNAFVNTDHGKEIARFMMESVDFNVTIEDFTSLITSTVEAYGLPFMNHEVLAIFHRHGIDLKTFFHYCVSKNFLYTAKFLHNLSPQEIDATTLCYAVRGSGVEMIAWLLELNPALELDEHFLHAVVKNHMYGKEVIDHFAAKLRAHINTVNREGKTPLHVAVDNLNLPLFETLLKIGADLSVKYMDWNMLIYCLDKMFLPGAEIVYAKDAKQLEGSNKRFALYYCAQKDKRIEEWLDSVGCTL